MDQYVEGSTYFKIPGCNHLFCVECTRNWFDSKNQEREQRCPFCNIVLDIEELRMQKREKMANDGGNNQVTPIKKTTDTAGDQQRIILGFEDTANLRHDEEDGLMIVKPRDQNFHFSTSKGGDDIDKQMALAIEMEQNLNENTEDLRKPRIKKEILEEEDY